jgi:pimeloyl-ACP methyl ester carboxylesterase
MRSASRALVGVLLVALGTAVGPVATHAEDPPRAEDLLAPGEPVARDFPADVLALLPNDLQEERAAIKTWADPRVGGWGGNLAGGASCRGWSAQRGHRTPVFLVHGTLVDAEYWRKSPVGDEIVNVRQRFLDDGYAPCELWAISYDGAPGYATSNDINVEEVYAFITRVQAYLGAPKVDVLAHSLGVTVVRKAGYVHPDLYQRIRNLVLIAGANHGTTTCRGLAGKNYSTVCDEVDPASPWLAELNRGPGGRGETPAGPRYLVTYDGTGLADNFYLGPDGQSPALQGSRACNVAMPLVPHNSLAYRASSVDVYLTFFRTGTCPPTAPGVFG